MESSSKKQYARSHIAAAAKTESVCDALGTVDVAPHFNPPALEMMIWISLQFSG
ncbi:hypothetical protein CCACVL1_18473 [Corchorus capsularis]|uniref:Uncharacterized protein n=1 Tax=Corchorus capsularis TaxID=210143 RepID=A0A1R3HLB0_COCAP|nr:hypothetical protein CCACVL1_18473 [Corchorus capsularis]